MPPSILRPNNSHWDVLCDHFAARREAVLLAWRHAVATDPQQTTARALTRGQLNDHIPQVLDAFERLLRARAGGAEARAADAEKKQEEVKHGLHRWQQGYRSQELMREWGHLQLCLFEEINAFSAAYPECGREVLVEAHRQLIALVNEAISGSAGQYHRMQQAEAAGHADDLRVALASVNEIERRRAALIHQAVHDLNSDVFGVSVAANLLGKTDLAETARLEFAALLKQGVSGVTAMLGELMDLARLEAGQERRELTTFNAAALVTELCDLSQPIARERGLFLTVSGPPEFSVEGDPGKVRRLLQNLVRNALSYTVRGGVSVSWGEEKENWWLMVKDTGPGLMAGHDAALVAGMKEATASARESDVQAAATTGETSHVLTPPPDARPATGPAHQPPGEGIGLSIVKRLCELLDASLEIASSAEAGTTFRVVLPRHYAPARPAG